MKIHLEIGELVFEGFNSYEQRLIKQAIENKLEQLMSEGQVDVNRGNLTLDIDAVQLETAANPEKIGFEIAKKISESLKQTQAF
jgi:hypothetical protein